MAYKPSVQADITGTNQFTTPIVIKGKRSGRVWGTFVATVVLQKSINSGGSFEPVYDKDGNAIEFTSPADFIIEEPSSGVSYRLGIPTGGAFTSGPAKVGIFN